MRPEVKTFGSPEEVASAFAQYLNKLTSSLPKLSIALSGGSTPKLLFKELVFNHRDTIDWKRTKFYWGDERCVPPEDDESNYGMTLEHLFSHVPIPAKNIHRIRGEEDPEGEALRYSKLLANNLETSNQWPVFDLIILGMGPDGHTASIFPDQMSLLSSDKICAVASHPESGQKRVTITGRTINQASRVAFLATGSEKADKIEHILTSSGNWKDFPAAHVQPAGSLSWYIDKSAANAAS